MPRGPILPPDAFADLAFPLKGLDVSVEYGRQPPGTCTTGYNVRCFESLGERARGGSRPGVVKYIDRGVTDGPAVLDVGALDFPLVVQHLNVIVDPTEEGLPSDNSIGPFDTDVPLVDDPSTNNLSDRVPAGRKVRDGGSGNQPNGKMGPDAVDDDLTLEVGDAAEEVDVLANDAYTGKPSVTIISGPTLDGASAKVVGTGASAKIKYTPPATGDGGADVIVYKLTASGNYGSATARLRVTVNTEAPPLQSTDGTFIAYFPGDGQGILIANADNYVGAGFGGTVVPNLGPGQTNVRVIGSAYFDFLQGGGLGNGDRFHYEETADLGDGNKAVTITTL